MKILDNWRKESRSKGAIPKTQFPSMLRRLCNSLKSQNLISRFEVTGIFPLDSNEVLKRLPSMNRDRGGEEVNESFNDSLMEMLQTYCGQGRKEKQTSKWGKKVPVTLGRAIDSLELPSTSAKLITLPQKKTNAPLIVSVSENNEEWFCGQCDLAWDAEGDDRWIVCDRCDQPFHLQCFGVSYKTRDYYSLNIERMDFKCNFCKLR